MIVDIEVRRHEDTGKLVDLRVSYFNKDGDIDYLSLPLNQARDGFVWDYCNSTLDNPSNKFISWDNKQVKMVRTSRLNRYRVEEILMNRLSELAPALEFNPPKKYIIDIETEISDGFPDPEFAREKVNAIGIVNCTDKKVTVCALKQLEEVDIDKISADINKYFEKFGDKWEFRYLHFESEYDMMYTFFNKMIQRMPCITGWNFNGFDWPYLINRAEKLKIDPSVASISNTLLGKQRLPQHRLIVDYMEIVKKWDRVIKIKENYRLDHIAEKATGLNKIKYAGTLKDLYEKDFVKFILYNAVDGILVHYLDKKLNTMNTLFKLAEVDRVEINRVFSPVSVQEALMGREFFRRGNVFVELDKNDTEQQHFIGAYVKEPVRGLHEWVTCFDFASLYPNTMMQFNISPESYLGKTTSDTAEPGKIIAANHNVFDNTKDSVLRTILTELYSKRKETKKRMLSINKEIDYLEKYVENNY